MQFACYITYAASLPHIVRNGADFACYRKQSRQKESVSFVFFLATVIERIFVSCRTKKQRLRRVNAIDTAEWWAMKLNDNSNDISGKQSVTIYDVARNAGVAPSTVNRALNNVGRVSKETQQRVRDVAAKLGYSPSFVARSLKNSRTKTLGVVVPILGETFVSSMVQGIESVAYNRGYNIIVCTTEYDNRRESHYYDLLCERRVEGIATVPTALIDSDEPFRKLLDLEDRGIPVVIM